MWFNSDLYLLKENWRNTLLDGRKFEYHADILIADWKCE